METIDGINCALGAQRGILLVLETFARAVAATHPDPQALWDALSKADEDVDIHRVTDDLSDMAVAEATAAESETMEALRAALRLRGAGWKA